VSIYCTPSGENMYRRDWLIGACAYHLQQQENMRLFYVCLINGIIIRTCVIYRIQITASLSDEDAVYLIESVVRGLHICKRVRSPTVCDSVGIDRIFILFFAQNLRHTRAFNLHAKTGMMTVLLRAFRYRSSLPVCRAVGHPG